MEPTEEINRDYPDIIVDYRLDADTYSTANTAFTSNGAFDGGLSPDFIQAVDSLWHDPIIPSVLDRSSEFYLMDSAPYFFDEIKRIGAGNYVPSETDVLHARTKTTGISETKFKSGTLSIQ